MIENWELKKAAITLADYFREALGLSKEDLVTMDHVKVLIKNLGGEIVYNASMSYETPAIERTEKGFVIHIAYFDYIEKSQMLVAIVRHIGELILQMGYMINDKVWANSSYRKSTFRDGLTDRDFEIRRRFGKQANTFVYEFLMPSNHYSYLLEKNRIGRSRKVDISSVAKYYGLRVNLVSARGKSDGYLEKNRF